MYYVIEFQTSGNGGAVIPFAFENQADAEAKYHELLAVAAKSSVEKHGVALATDDVFFPKKELYTHLVEQTT